MLQNWRPAPQKADTNIDEFDKTDIRVATVLECTNVKKSDRLLQFKLDDGMGGRTILSGIHAFYEPEELIGKRARLQQYEDAQKAMGELRDKLTTAAQLKKNWEEISKAIGSDGKDLRKIAQCYTLRFLVEHANAEIKKFNGRYELQQVRNSLALRIIDHDRADDIRDVTTLSGGETFIVSLGLALGLSSLSSGSIAFDNLFVDEGFGTLDPDMLATVIDSLAALQSSQGKKVGVCCRHLGLEIIGVNTPEQLAQVEEVLLR